jgi:16S rRNA (guanine966-N2)-methyltransferase
VAPALRSGTGRLNWKLKIRNWKLEIHNGESGQAHVGVSSFELPISNLAMRVISGLYRGLHLRTLKGGLVRPTSDRMRETLFNVLGDRVQGACFLDAYAGTGAVGIEALSRGARQVVFLESRRPAAELIRQNLQSVGATSGFKLLTAEVERGIERLEEQGAKFDFAFLDPPYADIREYHHVLRKFGRSSVINHGSKVIAEHSRRTRLEESYNSLVLARLICQGDSQLAFYRK